MKIIALSDLHGNLPNIKVQSDIVIIAGDFSPLYCQSDYNRSFDWLHKKIYSMGFEIKY